MSLYSEMRGALLLIVFSLGCSGGNFTVASGPGADGSIDTSSSTDAETDTSTGGDATSPGDTGTSDSVVAETGGPSCMSAEECPGSNQWCKRATCTATSGTCTALDTPNPYFAPVCGCDGITYWNVAHAESYGVATQHEGPCTPTEAKACVSGCDYCVRELVGMVGCAAGSIPGRCWRAPLGTVCTSTMSGPSVNNCDGKCKSMCQAIKDKELFYPQSCTPG